MFYFSALYREYIEPVKHRLYSASPLHLPFPQYLVFYNGTKNEPERQEIKLSDLFLEQKEGENPALECTVVVLNINLGQNGELMAKCRMLKEYAEFIAIIRKNFSERLEFEEAVEMAIEYCIENGILEGILRKNRAEVVDMILTEYDEEEVRKGLEEDAWNEGWNDGWNKGLNDGLLAGIKGTIQTCKKFHISKEQVIQNLMEEFSVSRERAEQYLEEYWK